MLHYLGPAGSYSEIAATQFDPSSSHVPHTSFRSIFAAVEADPAALGIIPIENRIEGVVRENLDLLYSSEARLCAELLLPIDHCLVVRNPDDEIKQILSHPQALAQCSDYLQANFPNIAIVPTTSTSAALDQLAHDEYAAAIGPRSAAQSRGLAVLAEGIGNHAENQTRFWVIRRGLNVLPAHDKFSLAFHFAADRPGTLYQALGFFAAHGVNLHSIHSRPLPASEWNYLFHLDAEGNLESEPVQAVLEALRGVAENVVLLGSCTAARAVAMVQAT